MDTKLLKQKILDLAIRGKLVPQDPNDEPASVLLERIRAEREKLMAEGKLKRSKTTTDNRHYENVPFEIPESWEWVQLGLLCSLLSTGPFGSMVHKSDYVSANGTYIVNPANIVDGTIMSDKLMAVSSTKAIELKRYTLQENDIVLARRGDLSKCAVVLNSNAGWICGTGSFFLHLILVSPFYFEIFYGSDYVQTILQNRSVGATMNNLNQNVLESIFFPLPPIAEQRRIVSQIEKYFKLIYEIDQDKIDLQEAIEQTMQKIVDLAVHGNLVKQDPHDEPAIKLLQRINPSSVPCDTSHYENIPQGWAISTVGEVANYMNGRAFKPTEWELEGLPIIRIQNLNDCKASYNYTTVTYEDKYLIKDGDLLFAWAASLGTYIWNGSNAWLNQHIFKVEPKEYMDKSFLYYSFVYLISEFYRQSHGSGMVHITKGKFENTPILIPPLTEQKRIVTALEEIINLIDTIGAEL